MTAPELSAVGEIAREGDPDRFLAALFAPPEARERLFALIAFNLELAKIPATVSEPILGEIRLQWWSEAIERLLSSGEAEGHEILLALAAAHRERPLGGEALRTMIAARRVALSDDLEGDPERIDAFVAGTAGALAQAGVGALGGDERAREVAAAAGFAEGAGRLIAALPAIIVAGGAPLPAEGKVDMNALREGRAPDNLIAAVRDLAVRGTEKLAAARARRREIPRAARPPLYAVHVVEPTLRAASQGNFDPFVAQGRSPFRARAEMLARAVTGRF